MKFSNPRNYLLNLKFFTLTSCTNIFLQILFTVACQSSTFVLNSGEISHHLLQGQLIDTVMPFSQRSAIEDGQYDSKKKWGARYFLQETVVRFSRVVVVWRFLQDFRVLCTQSCSYCFHPKERSEGIHENPVIKTFGINRWSQFLQ